MGRVVTESLVMDSRVVGKRILQLRGLLHLDYTSAGTPGRLGSGGFGQADGAGNLA
jgi:hypothetical protein